MQPTTLRKHLGLAVCSAAIIQAVPADATTGALAAFAADGRQLFIGSVVSQGTRSGGACLFDNDTVTVLADETTNSAVTVTADESCRLVVTDLSVPTSVDLGEATTYKRAKLVVADDGVGYTGGDVGAIPGQIGSVGPAQDPVALVLEAVDIAGSTSKVDVQVTQKIVNEAAVQEYRDFMAVQYVKYRRTETVGTMEPGAGYCEGSYIDRYVFNGPYANDILACFYKETSNGPSKVGFISGGTYRKSLAHVEIDHRKLSETYEATYTGATKRSCSTGGALPPLWSSICEFTIT